MEEEISAEELVQHPVYHGVCLAFWHTAQARGVAPMRSLSSGAIADAVYATVDIPKDHSTRQYVVAACSGERVTTAFLPTLVASQYSLSPVNGLT